MAKCLLCGCSIFQPLTLEWLLSLQPVQLPVVCPACQKEFETLRGQMVCPGCGRLQKNEDLCPDCQRWSKMGELELLNNRALYRYDQAMKDYMQRYKFAGDYRFRLVFQDQFSRFVQEKSDPHRVLVLIPVDEQTKRKRGFNQVQGLLAGFNALQLLAFRQKEERVKQSTKTRKARMETRQPFVYAGKKDLNGQEILLVDDIYTTGRTLYHAKHILQEHGAGAVHSLTLAR
ncbi:competence protein ComFC [Ligilactobacillus salitolerans]|uniref:Competence protein ComFC n=1 Tax=Ligilactobacillus salitolerans TaxID=1808352 RepID=A0A401IW38_9LACO|nr:ComF family protein [Ligilactobacillus salitolerans]GBG95754.1 competence protein ComFC [Ligilactobacillus salitolerans]